MTEAAVAPDAAARARALEPSTSFIVQAPAGSGKTTLLTQRYLALLARVPRPEAVLAITFTQKAAAEMRERVLKSLAAAAAGAAPENAAESVTLQLAAEVLAHADALGWQLTDQPARLRVQTIDSLNHWVAGRLPILSRAGVSLEIEPRAQPLYALAAERTVAAIDAPGPLSNALARVLAHLDNESDRLEDLLADMLSWRERWLRLIVGARGEALRAALEEALADVVSSALARLAAGLPDELAARLVTIARRGAARLVAESSAQGPDYAPLALAPAWPWPTDAASLPLWRRLLSLLLTQDGQWRRAVNKAQGFPPKPADEKAEFLLLLGQCASVPSLQALAADVVRLPVGGYADAEWAVLEALQEVLLAAAAELQQVFAERGRVDFVAVGRAALEALGTPEEPTDLTLALDERIEHILVDEFQDTSASQVALLERLTAGWGGGDGRTLFLVGDPMQSIYGFREANVSLFLQIKQRGLGAVYPEALRLEANFRSRPGLVTWFNEAFATVLPATEDLDRGAVRYSGSCSTRAPLDPPEPAVEVITLADASAAEEAARVVEIIQREQARNPGVRIAVLGRARTQLTPVAAALAAAAIRYQGVDLVPLAERLAVRDVVSLTRALLHLGDRVAWLACLRAPWCGLDLPALWALAGTAAGDDRRSAPIIWDALGDPVRHALLDDDARARVLAFRSVMERALADRGRLTLAACVEAAWYELGGPATLTDGTDIENVHSFFDRLSRLEQAGDLDDPPALAEELDALYAATDPLAGDGVQLLTIHRAKGLEWPVVILTGLGRGSRQADRQLLEWLEFARPAGKPGLLLAPHRARSKTAEPIEAWLRSLGRDRQRLELGRLVYVAATRAQERLYLVGHLVSRDQDGEACAPAAGTLLGTLWPAIEADARARCRQPSSEMPRRVVPVGTALLRLASGWQAPAPPAAVVTLEAERAGPLAGPSEFAFQWVTSAARHVGTVVHEELERISGRAQPIDRSTHGREAAWRRRLIELGVGPAQLAAAQARVAAALATTATDPRATWLFDPLHREAESEFALSTVSGGRVSAVRIDRTFIDAAGVRWIVDYKTSAHEGTDLDAFLDQEQVRYAPQLDRYAVLMSQLDPGRPIRLGLYFALHGGWREWAWAAPSTEAATASV